jgi:nucleotide-binding universal stress UspA family protein
MYDTILVPTDGSEGTDEAIRQGLELARAFDATVHALYVVDQTYPAAQWDFTTEREEELATRAVDAVAEQAAGMDVRVEKKVRRGVPHEEIIAYAEGNGVDLIVMGTHGRTGIDRFVSAGSVTERVVRHSPVPVLTARLPREAGRQ